MKGKVPKRSAQQRTMAKTVLKKGGYARGGATNEPDDCPTPANPKCKKAGGAVAKKRLDKPRRYATGGGVEESPAPKKGKNGTTVNIVIAGKGGPDAPPLPPPIPPGAGPAGPAPGMPPIPPGPPGMPPGMPPGAPPQMRKSGGRVKEYPIDAASGGGKGRLEKAAAQKSHRPKKGSK